MDWIKEVVSIKEKLNDKGFNNTANAITNAQMVLGTPGEMYLEVMNKLLDIKKNNPEEYLIIESEVNRLLEYGSSIGYFII